MNGLAHLDAVWDSVDTYSGFSLLPAGNRVYEITSTTYKTIEALGNKPVLTIGLRSSEGSGEHDIFLAPMNPTDPAEVDKFKRMLKTNLQRIGFEGLPSQLGHAIHNNLLVGGLVEVNVKHEPSGKVDPNTGESYMKAKVFLERCVAPANGQGNPNDQPSAAPAISPDLDHHFANAGPYDQPPVNSYSPF